MRHPYLPNKGGVRESREAGLSSLFGGKKTFSTYTVSSSYMGRLKSHPYPKVTKHSSLLYLSTVCRDQVGNSMRDFPLLEARGVAAEAQWEAWTSTSPQKLQGVPPHFPRVSMEVEWGSWSSIPTWK